MKRAEKTKLLKIYYRASLDKYYKHFMLFCTRTEYIFLCTRSSYTPPSHIADVQK